MSETVIVPVYYALRCRASGKFLGAMGERRPMSARYFLFAQEVAEARLGNMEHPNGWEAVVSPIQDDRTWYYR